MKCKVCAYEMSDDRAYCPICGTKVYSAPEQRKKDATEMAWNTKDFPRPKKLEDVNMSWGSDAFMSKDASEGYVTINKKSEPEQPFNWNTKPAPARPQNRDFEIPSFMQGGAAAPAQPQQTGYALPPREKPQTLSMEGLKMAAPSKPLSPVQAEPMPPGAVPARPAKRPIYTLPPEKKQGTQSPFLEPASDIPLVPAAPFGEQEKQGAEPQFVVWPRPSLQNASNQPLWYTQNFTATGVMKTGPAYPLPQDGSREQEPKPPFKDVHPRYASGVRFTPEQKTEPSYPAAPAYQPEPSYQAPPSYQPEPSYQASPSQQPEPSYQAPQSYKQPVYAQPDAASLLQSAMPGADIKYVTVEPPKPVYAEGGYPDYSDVPAREEKRPERFNTFRMKSDEFQKLLDQEYKRVYAIHGNEPENGTRSRLSDTFIPEASVKAQSVNEFAKNLLGQSEAAAPAEPAREQYTPAAPAPSAPAAPAAPAPSATKAPATPAAPALAPNVPPAEKSEETKYRFAHETDETELNLEELISDPRDPKFDIDTLEMTIRNLKVEVEKDEEVRSARRAKLKAMEAAREAYFASLDAADGKLDGKIDATLLSFDNEDSEKLSSEIKETIKKAPAAPEVKAPAPAQNAAKAQTPADPQPEESSAAPKAQQPSIAQSAPAPAQNAAAEDAAAQDAAPVAAQSTAQGEAEAQAAETKAPSSETPAETKAAEAGPSAEAKALPTEAAPETKAPASGSEPASEKESSDSAGFEAASGPQPDKAPEAKPARKDDDDTKDLSDDFKHLYDDEEDDDDDDDKPRKKHIFLKFLGVLVLVIVVLELAILALDRFAPDLLITEYALQINTAIVDGIKNLVTLIGDAVVGLLAKVQ